MISTKEAPVREPLQSNPQVVVESVAAPKTHRITAYRRNLLAKVKASPQWQQLTPTDRKYAATMILKHANPDSGGAMFPSQTTLAGYFETTRRRSESGRQHRTTAWRHLRSIVKAGVFVKENGGPSRGGVNVYRVNPELLAQSSCNEKCNTECNTEATQGSSLFERAEKQAAGTINGLAPDGAAVVRAVSGGQKNRPPSTETPIASCKTCKTAYDDLSSACGECYPTKWPAVQAVQASVLQPKVMT